MTTKPDLQLHKIGIFKIIINDQLMLIEKWIFIVMGVFSLFVYPVFFSLIQKLDQTQSSFIDGQVITHNMYMHTI